MGRSATRRTPSSPPMVQPRVFRSSRPSQGSPTHNRSSLVAADCVHLFCHEASITTTLSSLCYQTRQLNRMADSMLEYSTPSVVVIAFGLSPVKHVEENFRTFLNRPPPWHFISVKKSAIMSLLIFLAPSSQNSCCKRFYGLLAIPGSRGYVYPSYRPLSTKEYFDRYGNFVAIRRSDRSKRWVADRLTVVNVLLCGVRPVNPVFKATCGAGTYSGHRLAGVAGLGARADAANSPEAGMRPRRRAHTRAGARPGRREPRGSGAASPFRRRRPGATPASGRAATRRSASPDGC
jgi:hypothetical protein